MGEKGDMEAQVPGFGMSGGIGNGEGDEQTLARMGDWVSGEHIGWDQRMRETEKKRGEKAPLRQRKPRNLWENPGRSGSEMKQKNNQLVSSQCTFENQPGHQIDPQMPFPT